MRRRLAHVFLLLWLCFAFGMRAQAQTEENRRSPGLGRLAVSYDLSNGHLGSTLPFDVGFDLAVTDKSGNVRAIAISLFESSEPFQAISCGPASHPPCSEESWRCIAERGATVFQDGPVSQKEWPKRHAPTDAMVNCAFMPNVSWLAPVHGPSNNNASRTFYLPLPPLGANKNYQILFRVVEGGTTPNAQAVIDEFKRQAAATIIDHFMTLNPANDPPGTFQSASEKLLDALRTAARSRGLELIADPEDPLLQALGPAGGPSAEEQLRQRLASKGPSLLTDLRRIPLRMSACPPEIQTLEAELGNLKRELQAPGTPADLTKGQQLLEQLLKSDADSRIPFLARAQTPPPDLDSKSLIPPDPCSDIDASVLQQANAFHLQLQDSLAGLRDTASQRQPPLPTIQQHAQAAANAAFRLADLTRLIADTRTRAQQTAADLASDMTQAMSEERILFARASTIGTFESRQKWQIAGDFGFIYAPELGEAAPHLGTNFYFRPVNKQAPLRWCPRGCFNRGWFQPGRRLSATIGLVLTDIGDGRTRDPLFETSKFSIIVGGGVRLSDAVRLGGGGVLFRERDSNPLIDDSSLVISPYVSLSLDWDLRDLVQWVGRVFNLGGAGPAAASGAP